MDKFIGLGSDHMSRVDAYATRILKRHRPDAITIEQVIHNSNIGENSSNPRWNERITELSSPARYNVSMTPDPMIEANDLVLFESPWNEDHFYSEKHAAILYAIKAHIPFYFTDFSNDWRDHIFMLQDGVMTPINIAGHTTYQEHPEEYMRTDSGLAIICMENVDARNRFMSDAINFISPGYRTIAHVSGRGHFDASMPQANSWLGITIGSKSGTQVQDLVAAKEKVIYDLVKKRRMT
jgi:hypothetical protein